MDIQLLHISVDAINHLQPHPNTKKIFLKIQILEPSQLANRCSFSGLCDNRPAARCILGGSPNSMATPEPPRTARRPNESNLTGPNARKVTNVTGGRYCRAKKKFPKS